MAVPLKTLGSPRNHPSFPRMGRSDTGTVCGPGGQHSLVGDGAEDAQRCLVSWCLPWHHSAIPEHPGCDMQPIRWPSAPGAALAPAC